MNPTARLFWLYRLSFTTYPIEIKKLSINSQHNIDYSDGCLTRLSQHAAFAGMSALGRFQPNPSTHNS